MKNKTVYAKHHAFKIYQDYKRRLKARLHRLPRGKPFPPSARRRLCWVWATNGGLAFIICFKIWNVPLLLGHDMYPHLLPSYGFVGRGLGHKVSYFFFSAGLGSNQCPCWFHNLDVAKHCVWEVWSVESFNRGMYLENTRWSWGNQATIGWGKQVIEVTYDVIYVPIHIYIYIYIRYIYIYIILWGLPKHAETR